jgi:proteic killer suppression protein
MHCPARDGCSRPCRRGLPRPRVERQVFKCYAVPVIASFADATTEDIFNGTNSKAARSVPKELWKIAGRKLSAIDYATDLSDLSSPGNNLEKLKGALSGKYSIRINDQFRIVFNFERGEATNVVITDYHR